MRSATTASEPASASVARRRRSDAGTGAAAPPPCCQERRRASSWRRRAACRWSCRRARLAASEGAPARGRPRPRAAPRRGGSRGPGRRAGVRGRSRRTPHGRARRRRRSSRRRVRSAASTSTLPRRTPCTADAVTASTDLSRARWSASAAWPRRTARTPARRSPPRTRAARGPPRAGAGRAAVRGRGAGHRPEDLLRPAHVARGHEPLDGEQPRGDRDPEPGEAIQRLAVAREVERPGRVATGARRADRRRPVLGESRLELRDASAQHPRRVPEAVEPARRRAGEPSRLGVPPQAEHDARPDQLDLREVAQHAVAGEVLARLAQRLVGLGQQPGVEQHLRAVDEPDGRVPVRCLRRGLVHGAQGDREVATQVLGVPEVVPCLGDEELVPERGGPADGVVEVAARPLGVTQLEAQRPEVEQQDGGVEGRASSMTSAAVSISSSAAETSPVRSRRSPRWDRTTRARSRMASAVPRASTSASRSYAPSTSPSARTPRARAPAARAPRGRRRPGSRPRRRHRRRGRSARTRGSRGGAGRGRSRPAQQPAGPRAPPGCCAPPLITSCVVTRGRDQTRRQGNGRPQPGAAVRRALAGLQDARVRRVVADPLEQDAASSPARTGAANDVPLHVAKPPWKPSGSIVARKPGPQSSGT